MLLVVQSGLVPLKGSVSAVRKKQHETNLRVVIVEVLVYIKDEIGDATVWVGDFAQCCSRTVGDEGLGGSPVVAWKQDNLRRSTTEGISAIHVSKDVQTVVPGITNGCDGSLDCLRPRSDVRNVMRLVHEAEYDAWFVEELFGELSPEADIFVVGRSPLGNDLSIPTSIVMLDTDSRQCNI